ncbi:tRNA (guanine-N7-)-methyltransferase [Kribbella sp. VKM Ac-2527]|uniref:tRNA (guanine-N(7)-)-methyltransferase n=1 Tax=Kribbella caucasensis TaxID=2512215 RepID=A0A4V3C6F8_9ACTN|nr:tRNA (guanine-N7-)-methyltransferase [Kribbella sp. VKM Ac-2527]
MGVVSHVRRSVRMTAGQQRVWDTHWPQLGRKLEEMPSGQVDLAEWFGRTAPTVLEIGSGMGDATAQLALADPDVDHLAAEVYPAGLGQLMLWVERYGLDNVRLLHGDALDLLRDHLAPESLAGVRIYFPDPWPKKRHHKRRLITAPFVSLVASRLQPGGTLHLATDWANYADQMLAVCTAEPSLANQYADWAPRPEWRPITKFESRAQADGRVCRDLLFTKSGS